MRSKRKTLLISGTGYSPGATSFDAFAGGAIVFVGVLNGISLLQAVIRRIKIRKKKK
jgi:hypothetical protein